MCPSIYLLVCLMFRVENDRREVEAENMVSHHAITTLERGRCFGVLGGGGGSDTLNGNAVIGITGGIPPQ